MKKREKQSRPKSNQIPGKRARAVGTLEQVAKALFGEVVQLKAQVSWLMSRDLLRSKDPHHLSPDDLTQVGRTQGLIHDDLLEKWAKLLDDDVTRQEALLAGIDLAADEAQHRDDLPPTQDPEGLFPGDEHKAGDL